MTNTTYKKDDIVWWQYEKYDSVCLIEATVVDGSQGDMIVILCKDPWDVKPSDKLYYETVYRECIYSTRDEAEFVLNLSNAAYEIINLPKPPYTIILR